MQIRKSLPKSRTKGGIEWIVVADRFEAFIYQRLAPGFTPKVHQVIRSAHARNGVFAEEGEPASKDLRVFAKQISRVLAEAQSKRLFDELALVADAGFLIILFTALDVGTKEFVRDVTKQEFPAMDPIEIKEFLVENSRRRPRRGRLPEHHTSAPSFP